MALKGRVEEDVYFPSLRSFPRFVLRFFSAVLFSLLSPARQRTHCSPTVRRFSFNVQPVPNSQPPNINNSSVLARPSYSTSSTSPSTFTPIRPTSSLSTYANFILSPSQNHTPPPTLIFLINYQTSMILGPFISTEEEILVEKDRIFKGRFRRQVKVEPVLGEVLRSRIGHAWIEGEG